MTAPVQLLVLAYDEPHFAGEALAEARRLEAAGIARVIDLLVVRRDGSGELETVDVEGLPNGSVATRFLTASSQDAVGETGWSLEHVVPAHGTVVLVLLEHLWAAGLVSAIGRTGGRPLDELWLGADDRARLESIVADVSAEETSRGRP